MSIQLVIDKKKKITSKIFIEKSPILKKKSIKEGKTSKTKKKH